MRKLIVLAFVTLDGVMQAPGAPDEDPSGNFSYGGWVFPLADDDMGKIITDIFSRADAFLLGRTTYDIFSAYWPRVTDPKDSVAAKLNSLPKFVASRSRSAFTWQNTKHVPDVEKDVVELKKLFGRELQVHGSAGLAQTLIRKDLVDEYRLLVFPVIIGTGKKLFGTGAVPRSLKLMRSSKTGAGAVFSVYRRAGDLKTGSFALD